MKVFILLFLPLVVGITSNNSICAYRARTGPTRKEAMQARRTTENWARRQATNRGALLPHMSVNHILRDPLAALTRTSFT